MISFHVASLLANESVDQAIDIILLRIYKDKEIPKHHDSYTQK